MTRGPSKPAARRRGDEVGEVDHALPGGGEAAVRGAVLGVRHGDCGGRAVSAAASTRRRRSAGSARSKRLAGSSTMRRRGLAISSRRRRAAAGVGDDVGEFGLDAEVDVVALGERDGALPSPSTRSRPGVRAGVVRVPAPLVVGVAGAGAERDEPRAHGRAGGGEDGEPAHARPRGPPGRGGSCCRCRRRRRCSTPVCRDAAAISVGDGGLDARPAWRAGRGRPC